MSNEPRQGSEIINALRSAWITDAPPDLASLLAAIPQDDEAAWSDALVCDAENRAERELACGLDFYLTLFPWLKPGSEPVQALLVLEVGRGSGRNARGVQSIIERVGERFSDDVRLACQLGGLLFDEPASLASPVPGQRFGKYELRIMLGTGTFGQVWQAWDTELQCYIALKLIQPRGNSDLRMELLLTEARAASGIDHPNVVGVRAAGRFDEGWLYLDIQLCGDMAPTPEDPKAVAVGSALPEALEKTEWSPRETARLMADICRGVVAAHAQGVVHCDLKPTNVMLTPSGRAMVADFGLSSSGLLDPDTDSCAPDNLTRTRAIQTRDNTTVCGTPAYMAPEQARGGLPRPISDVYGLGGILFWLLSRRDPVTPRSGETYHELLARVADVSQPPPSLPTGANPTLARICHRAMARHHENRYQSATEMQGDLDAYLATRVPPIIGSESPSQPAKLWIRRNKGLVAAAIVLALVSAIGLIVSVTYALGEAEQKANALTAESAATEAEAATSLAKASAAERRVAEQRQRYAWALSTTQLAKQSGHNSQAIQMLSRAPKAERGWEWSAMDSILNQSLALLPLDSEEYTAPGIDHAQLRVVVGTKDNRLVVLRVEDGEELAALAGLEHPVNVAAFRPKHDEVVTLTTNGMIQRWNAEDLTLLEDIGDQDYAITMGFSDDGRFLAVSSSGGLGTATIYDLKSGAQTPLAGRHAPRGRADRHAEISCLEFSPDNRWLVTSGWDAQAIVWDRTTGQRVTTFTGLTLESARTAFHPSGRWLATTYGTSAAIWDTATWELVAKVEGHEEPVSDVAFSEDGLLLVTASWDMTLRVWSTENWALRQVLHGHDGFLRKVWSGSRSATIASWSPLDGIRVWDLATPASPLVLTDGIQAIRTADFSPDGRRLITTGDDGWPRVYSTASGRLLAILPRTANPSRGGWYSPDGSLFVLHQNNPTILLLNARTFELRQRIEIERATPSAIAFRPDSKAIAVAYRDGYLRIFDTATGEQIQEVGRFSARLVSVAWNPAGKAVVVGAEDGTVSVVDSGSQEILFEHREGPQVPGLCFSPDGSALFASSEDTSIREFKTAPWGFTRRLKGQESMVRLMAFNPSGDRLATASFDSSVMIYRMPAGTPLLAFRDHSSYAFSARWSPDGSMLATTSADRTCRVYNSAGALDRRDQAATYQSLFMTLEPAIDELLTDSREDPFERLDALGLPAADRSIADDVLLSRLYAPAAKDSDIAMYLMRAYDFDAFQSSGIVEEISNLEGIVVSAGVQAQMIEIVQKSGDSPASMNQAIWPVVADRTGPAIPYHLAWKAAERMYELAPDDAMLANTVGVARYRAGHFEDAIVALRRSIEGTVDGAPAPHDLAFIAMSLIQLNRPDEAIEVIEQLRASISLPQWTDDAEARAFWSEAENAWARQDD